MLGAECVSQAWVRQRTRPGAENTKDTAVLTSGTGTVRLNSPCRAHERRGTRVEGALTSLSREKLIMESKFQYVIHVEFVVQFFIRVRRFSLDDLLSRLEQLSGTEHVAVIQNKYSALHIVPHRLVLSVTQSLK